MRIEAIRRRRVPLSMTSLIDVIFLLLLFFMLSSTFTRYQRVEIAGGGVPSSAARTPDVLVRLEGQGTARVNGEHASIAGLSDRLEVLRSAGGTSVLVLATEQADSQSLIETVEAARRAGFAAVSVSN
jgi:biopolymer transport protein ExbD